MAGTKSQAVKIMLFSAHLPDTIRLDPNTEKVKNYQIRLPGIRGTFLCAPGQAMHHVQQAGPPKGTMQKQLSAGVPTLRGSGPHARRITTNFAVSAAEDTTRPVSYTHLTLPTMAVV